MNPEHIISELKQLTEEIGLRHFENNSIRFETLDIKSRNQLVTNLDIQVEKELVEGLRQILPQAGFLTEEKTVNQEEKRALRWIIDPIDGTTNFVHNIPAFAISIGLEDDKGIAGGIIYELNRKEFFSAWRGKGSFLNGEHISVAESESLEESLIATGFPYFDYSLTPQYLRVLEHFMRKSRGVRRMGSAAMDLAYVACGRFDAFYEYSLNPWDVAAGSLIVQEAGGTVCDFMGGGDFIYGKSIIAAQNNVYKEVAEIIKETFA